VGDPDGHLSFASINDQTDLGLQLVTCKRVLPSLYEWQCFQSGHYVLGIEPSTRHVLGDLAARDRGEMIWLEPGGRHVGAGILDGAREIANAESQIRRLAKPPDQDYPGRSGVFARLGSGASWSLVGRRA
jgi:hypothetical protein